MRRDAGRSSASQVSGRRRAGRMWSSPVEGRPSVGRLLGASDFVVGGLSRRQACHRMVVRGPPALDRGGPWPPMNGRREERRGSRMWALAAWGSQRMVQRGRRPAPATPHTAAVGASPGRALSARPGLWPPGRCSIGATGAKPAVDAAGGSAGRGLAAADAVSLRRAYRRSDPPVGGGDSSIDRRGSARGRGVRGTWYRVAVDPDWIEAARITTTGARSSAGGRGVGLDVLTAVANRDQGPVAAGRRAGLVRLNHQYGRATAATWVGSIGALRPLRSPY